LEYKVKGITFTMDELSSIPLMDIKTQTVSRSHLFHFLPGNKSAVMLLRAGDYVEPDFIAKYLDRGLESVYQLPIVSEDDLLVYRSFWERLRNCRTQQEQFKTRDEVIKRIALDFFQNREKCFLSFVISCFDEFHIYQSLVMDKFQRSSLVLYSRALLTSSISVVASLCSGYADYKFIKDFYNTCFIMDYGLVEYQNYNFTIGMACESERKDPGTGLSLLERMKRSKGEIQTFLQHPNMSYEYAITQSENFHHPEILEMIKMHHEKTDGLGFPNGYSYSAMSDSETLLTFCDYMVPFEEHEFVVGDGFKILFDGFGDLKRLTNKNRLPILKVIKSWDEIMKWAIESARKVDKEVLGEAS